jgi:hypothetical protein
LKGVQSLKVQTDKKVRTFDFVKLAFFLDLYFVDVVTVVVVAETTLKKKFDFRISTTTTTTTTT